MTKDYKSSLIEEVLNNSKNKHWELAVEEWEIEDCIEDPKREQSCICGKEKLRYLFEIRNKENGQLIFPIGSSCIKKFEREDLDEDVNIYKQMHILYDKIKKNEPIKVNGECFSKKLLEYFYKEGVFKPNEYNKFNPQADLIFMLDMFNKRNNPTENQQKKIRGIIYFTIKPYLQNKIKIKEQNILRQKDDEVSL